MAQARAMIESPPADPEASIRRDLTHLKVYAIDSEDTNEVSPAQPGAGVRGFCCGGVWGAVCLTTALQKKLLFFVERGRRPTDSDGRRLWGQGTRLF